MGLLNFLKSFGKKREEVMREAGNSATLTWEVKPEKELFECYAEVFKREFANVVGFSPSEVAEVYKFISNSDGGFLNMFEYYRPVHEMYFMGREWTWTEYDYWDARFSKLGKFPVSFVRKTVDYVDPDMALESILDRFKVAELKELLSSRNVEFGQKDKKRDLIRHAKNIPDVRSDNMVRAKIAATSHPEGYWLFEILMRTIHQRSISLYNYNRCKKLGIEQFTVMHGIEENKEFAEMILKENPIAIPPFYPYDKSMLKPVISGLDT